MSIKNVRLLLVAGISLVGIMGCQGSTDGGSGADQDGSGSGFVSTDDNTGSISLNVVNTTIDVADTSGFTVEVKDRNGNPVSDIKVSCDTEQGLGILEPSTGSELTGDFGIVSGSIGCEAPGSYQMACRLPIGVNKRKTVTIRCTGDVPSGFNGFGGAGGGLGGGSGGNVTPSGVVKITSIEFLDTSDENTADLAIDVVGNSNCDDDGATVDPEDEFVDTRVRFTIVNDSFQTIRFTRMTYTIDNAADVGGTGPNNRFTSSSISLIGEAEVTEVGTEGEEAEVTALFTNVTIPSTSTDGSKRFIGSSTNIPATFGFRNINFTLTGRNGSGETVTVSGTTGATFRAVDRCG